MNHPPGTIGIITATLARYSEFQVCLEALHQPPGTQLVFLRGLWTANALNRIIAKMAPESQWLQLWADDHRFRPDCLLRLLAHEVDLVAPFCLLRSPPFRMSMLHEVEPEAYQFYRWQELDAKQGLLAVDTCGGPGVVIRRRVLDAVGPPWFTGLAGEHPQEDLSTFARWRTYGFQPYIDLSTTIGHLTTMSVEPELQPDGTWAVKLWSEVDLCLLPALNPSDLMLRESESK
jgi:hypothetical protein